MATSLQHYLAIEIGGTKLQIVIGDDQAKVGKRFRFKVEKKEGAEGIRKQIVNTLHSKMKEIKFLAAGIGFGGPVDWQKGKICQSHQIEGWSDFALANWLGNKINAPVFIENDANVAALGEALYGAGKAFGKVFYVTLGSGVGGGLVIDENIYHGAIPGEMEIGHIRLNKFAQTLESSCSGWAVDEKIRKMKHNYPESVLTKLTEKINDGEARYLATALEQQDKFALHILQHTADDLSFGLSHVIYLIHPDVIVFGGGLSLIGAPLFEAVTQKLPGYIMKAFHPAPAVLSSQLKEDAVPLGALALAIRQLKKTQT